MRFRDLITMWASPRLAAWFVLCTALLLACRLLFAWCPVIPGVVPLRPGIVLVPLLGIFCGPAAVWAAACEALVGGVLTGLWGTLIAAQALAGALAAWMAQRLWDRHSSEAAAWRSAASARRFLWLALPSVCALSAWPALAGAMAGLYPFPYLLLLHGAQDLLFLLLLGPVLYRWADGGWRPLFGTWHAALLPSERTPPPGWCHLLLWTGGLGAWILGVSVAGGVYGCRPWPGPALGATDGWWSWVVVWGFLLLQTLGLACPRVSPAPGTPPGRRFRHLHLPPIVR